MNQPVLQVDDLVVEYTGDSGYAVRPLDGFSMTVEPGQLVGLVGPSGSGKTTLLSVLSGMIPATSGSVRMGDIDVLSLSGDALQDYRRNRIGIVFQGFNLLPSLTARENVAAPLILAGTNRRTALKRADQLLEQVGLGDRGQHKPNHLSGGQQQRVAVARGLVADPPLLLADEPTANLDVISTEAVVALLRDLRSAGRSIIISTHDNRLMPAVDAMVEMAPAPVASEAAGGLVELAAGQVLFRQGDPSDFVWEILDGTVDVARELADGSEEILAARSAGSYIGELGPLLGFPRSATVRACTATRLRSISAHEFRLKGLERDIGSYSARAN